MASSLDDFGGEVLWGSAETICFIVESNALLGKTEVSYPNVALRVQENIFGLQVSVDDAVRVQAANGLDHLGSVDLGSELVELAFFSQICEHLASIEEVDDEVELGFGLEGVVQTHDVRIFDILQNVSLR